MPQGPLRCSDGGESIFDAVFRALSHQYRRYTLYHLRDRDQTTVTALARQIAAWERDVPLEAVPADLTERIAIELTHSHLPQLAERHLLDYDPRSGDIRYGSPPALLEKIIDVAMAVEKPT